jgi:integrase
LQFLKAREARLKEYGIKECYALVPNVHSKDPDMIYSTSRFRAIKEELQTRVGKDIEGFEFQLKSFRDMYCQMNIDLNPSSLSAVALTMGHSTTRTTESHYGRIRQEKAFEMLESAWSVNNGKKALIEQKYEMTGYN